MGRLKKFEDLVAWKQARVLTGVIYKVTGHSEFLKTSGLHSEMCNAAVSIASNIARGFEYRDLEEFYRCLTVAQTRCIELRTGIHLAENAKYISQEEFKYLVTQLDTVAQAIDRLQTLIKPGL